VNRLRLLLVALVALWAAVVAAAAPSASSGEIPGARAVRACAGAGPYWPTMTLALQGTATAWVACKEQRRVVRVALASGRKTASVRVGGAPIAVAIGLGSLWALDSESTLYRLNARTGRVVKRIQLGANAAYNIWIGAGAVWVADDQGAGVIRVSPSANRVVARIGVGDGPADMVFRGRAAWIVTHRDNTIFRLNATTNVATRVGALQVADAAAERLALLGGSLWVTGRGFPLVEVDPESGETRRSVDIGGTGIDVVAASGALWVPVRTPAVDRTGFPTMTAVRRVTADGSGTTEATARGRVDVHGLAAAATSVWIADNTTGFLYRLPS
jgi:hypothetical protein